MALNHRDYNPDLMQGASETLSDDLTVTDTLTVGGLSTLATLTVTGTTTLTGAQTLTGAATLSNTLSVAGAVTITGGGTSITISPSTTTNPLGINFSALTGTQRVMKITGTTDTPVSPSGTSVNIGWMKIDVAGTARYIPFFN